MRCGIVDTKHREKLVENTAADDDFDCVVADLDALEHARDEADKFRGVEAIALSIVIDYVSVFGRSTCADAECGQQFRKVNLDFVHFYTAQQRRVEIQNAVLQVE